MKAIVAGLLMMLAAVPAAVAADNPMLAGLVGDWIGRGTMKLRAEAEPERLYCKITNTLNQDGVTLEQKGRCTLSSNSGRIDGAIKALGAGRYGGTLNSLASKGPATLEGRGTATRLDLDAEFVDALTGQPAKSVNTIELLSKGGYRLSTVRINPKDGTTFTSSDVVFSAK